MKRSAALLSLLLLAVAPLRAESTRFYDEASDYLQVLHQCLWASQVNVDGRRPLVPLVLALDEQSRNLNEARLLLLTHADEPIPEARRAVESLLSGIGLFSLCVTADLADINAMNDRWELSQKLEGRRADRKQAEEVMAGSVGFFKSSLYEKVVVQEGRRKKTVIRPRLTLEESASLWKQLNLFFGKELAGGGAATSPLLAAIDDLRKAIRGVALAPAEADAPAQNTP
jgi:hypothetical protein